MYDLKLVAPGPPGVTDPATRNNLLAGGLKFAGNLPVRASGQSSLALTHEGWTYQFGAGVLRLAYPDTDAVNSVKGRLRYGIFHDPEWDREPTAYGFDGRVNRVNPAACRRLEEWLVHHQQCDTIIYWFRGNEMTRAYRLKDVVMMAAGQQVVNPVGVPELTGQEPLAVPVGDGEETEEVPPPTREEQIIAAMKTYEGRYTAAGKPHMNDLRNHAGMDDITTAERDRLWEAMSE